MSNKNELKNANTAKPKNTSSASGRAAERAQTHRYNLELTKSMFDEVKNASDRNGCTVLEMLRKFIKIGLVAVDQNSKLIIRRGNTDTEILIV